MDTKEYKDGLMKRFPVLDGLTAKLKVFTLPGFDGIPVYDVYQFFVAEIRANSLGIRSRAIAFSFFLALFPALTFVFSLIPYIPYFSHLDEIIMNNLQQVLPNKETYAFIKSFTEPLLRDLAKHKRGGLLTGSVFMVIFLTSNGVMAMLSSFDKSYDHYKKRNALQSRFIALKITALLFILFIFSTVLIFLGQTLLDLAHNYLHVKGTLLITAVSLLRYLIIILMLFFGISLIYYYGPAVKKKYKFISTGATVATFLSILVSIGFSYWVSNFNRLNVIFGSIGTIMLLMIWLNINSFVLLIGYEINASIHYNRHLRQRQLDLPEEDKTL
ncbi:MAG: YihY/virulence factor BrkB family protein [Chitinophagales bacterium]